MCYFNRFFPSLLKVCIYPTYLNKALKRSIAHSFLIKKFFSKDQNIQVNLLSVILNDAPILPEEDDEDVALLVKDSPQCMTFGLFMIW